MNNVPLKTTQTIESFNPDLNAVLSEIEEGHYLFIVADKKKAFLVLFNKGIVEDSREFMHPGVAKMIKTDSGELHGRNDKHARHIDKQLQQHLQLLMQEVDLIIRGKPINGVFIGGHKPLHHELENTLAKVLQEKVRGSFITELNISHEALINNCTQVLKEYIQ